MALGVLHRVPPLWLGSEHLALRRELDAAVLKAVAPREDRGVTRSEIGGHVAQKEVILPLRFLHAVAMARRGFHTGVSLDRGLA